MRLYRLVSIVFAISFAVVGILFASIPSAVVNLFNGLSAHLGMEELPEGASGFYVVLAAAYMYVVALLAFMMYLHPRNRIFAFLLIHAKSGSSILSLLLFLLQSRSLIYITNFAVDGLIAVAVLAMYAKFRRDGEWQYS